MLSSLSINNYALITSLDISFNRGFTIITGETGAGKSILLGALSLILGQRADTGVLKIKDKKCFVEAAFNIKGYKLENFFKTNDIDFDNITVIRREITPAGKSRGFVNDTPVNLNILKELGYRLVDIHSQHQNLILNDENFQIKLVDVFARQTNILDKYCETYELFLQLENDFNELIRKSEQSKSDLDYLQFQFNQLEEAKLNSGEQEDLEKELEILNHAEEIKSALGETNYTISNDDAGILVALKKIAGSLEKIRSYNKNAEDYINRINSVLIELKDISDESEILQEGVEFIPSRAEEVNQRLDLIYNLQQKHKVDNISGLISLKDKLELELNNINSYDLRISVSRKELLQQKTILEELAKNITENRNLVIPEIENTITGKLKKLGIPHAGFKIDLTTFEEFFPNGKDKVEFLFSANKKTELQEVSRVASGGEISRLMLSIKSLITSTTALPTIIFDEIDSGISGEIADKMGDIIKEMSKDIQVINITHLPQIARKGDFHFLVYKYEDSESTYTDIKLLEMEDRVIEIAKMLSGADITDLSLKTARELLINEQKN